MATWRIRTSMVFDLTSEQLEDHVDTVPNRPGPRGDLLAERVFLDSLMLRFRLGNLLGIEAGSRLNGVFVVNGINVKSGLDGELVPPDEFRSNSVTLANADVGRVIRVFAGQTPLLSRGHYLIMARNNPNSVTVEGVLPVAASGLQFQINEPGEALATLVSTP